MFQSSAAATLEMVSCDLCGRDDAVLLVIKNGFRVVRCQSCTLVYVNPRPKATALSAQYETSSFFGHQVERANDQSWRPEAEARVALINRLHPARGRLLDVGCSAGWFMSVALAAGWKVSGIDISAPSVAYSKSRGFDAHVATLDRHNLPAASFDVITMFDCIEHMPSPISALRAVRTLLAPGGIVMLTTPNVEGLFPRLTYQLFGRCFGAWDHPGPPGHIYQFGMSTISAALERNGFSIVHQRTEAIPLDFSVGALEDVIVDVLKGSARGVTPQVAVGQPARNDPEEGAASQRAVREARSAPGRGSAPGRMMRRMARGAGRCAAWALAGAVSAPAQMLGKGDSLMIVAKAASD